MIKDIQELNFPSYATMSAATVSLPDMGEWNITSQIKIGGQIAPDFSFDWAVVHDGHKYIMPLRKPQGSKDDQKPPSVIDLTFQHWAIWQLKRWPFVTMQPIDSGTAVADEEVATVSLNLGDFCNLFGQVLSYYYGDKITIQLNPDWQYKAEAEVITISHTKVWNVLIEVFHKKFGVRWKIEPNGDYDKYVIKVGYPTTEQSHIFEYGFQGGLMKVERQVQSEEICNLLKGRGGEKNLPYRYFKNVDPQNDTFKADPDWIEELANIYFSNLMPATFRSYVQGWKAAHISKYPGYTAVGEANAYAPWAYRKGFTDTKFHPVEFVADEITINPEAGDRQVEILPGYSPFVKKGSSLDKYGPLMNSLDNNEDIYPTIQGVTIDPYGRIDEAVAVEKILSDDIEEAAENDAQIATLPSIKSATLNVKNNARQTFTLNGELTVPQGKNANLITDLTTSARPQGSGASGTHRPNVTDGVIVESTVTLKNKSTGETQSASGIPAGDYTYQITANVHNTSGQDLNITVSCPTPKLQDATLDDKWKGVWRIWVKNIWGTSKQEDETPEQYAKRVWEPILGDRAGNEAKVVFASGLLAHEDYEFTITSIPKYERKKCTWETVENGQIVEHEYWSEWCIELGKSDAELETLGVYLPSVMRQAKAGDFFFFIGIDMPHQYTVWNEIRIDDDWKKPILGEKKDIKPTWVVQTDRVRLNNEGKPNALIRQLHPGDTLRLADKRFIEGDYETLYLSSLTITYREPTSDDAALNPDVEIVLSDRYEVSANPVATLQGEVSALAKQVGSISNVEQIVRAVGDKLYLRKDGLPDRSMSPTEFASLLTSLGFRSGMVGGAGWGIYKDANGNWVIEADRFMARQDFDVNNLVINQVVGQGGTIVESAARMEITRVEDVTNGYKCYFDQHEGTVANLFHVDDVAWNNRFTPENNSLKFYRRRVTEVGADYVVLSKTDVNGVGIPAEGDAIVQRGNYTDANRQYIKVRDVIGGGYERYIEGLDSVNAEGVQYYYIGRQAGVHNGRPYFFLGDDNGFIEWVDGVLNIKGKLNTLSTIGDTTIDNYVNNAAQAAADAAKAELQSKIDTLQNQVDGVIESFNGEGAPTLNNYPANEWTTDEERQRHDRDIYTDITPYVDEATTPTSGQSWKWYYNSPTDYGWTKIADSEAVRALQLAQMSVLGTDVLFKQGTSQSVAPTPLPTVNASGTITNLNGWSTDAPEWEAGKYIWQTTYVKKGDGTATFSDPTCISGRNGVDGASVTISSQSVKYSTDHGATQPADSTFTLTAVPTLTAGQYLWSMTTVTYSNGQSTKSYAVSRVGVDGANGTSVTITSTSVRYAKTSNTTQPADSAFTYTSIGAVGLGAGDYLWTKTEVNYSDGTSTKSYTVSRIGADGADGTPGAAGADGQTPYVHFAYASGITGNLPHPTAVTGFSTTSFAGAKYIGVCTDYNQTDPTTNVEQTYEWSEYKGDDGNGIDRIEEEYYLSTSRTALQGGSWSTTRQPWVAGHFYWTRSHVYYTDGTDEAYGEVCVTGETGASAPNLLTQYSADAASWHPAFTAGDVWMRTSNDGGSTWSAAMPFVGSSYTPNLLLNSAFDGADNWAINPQASIDSTRTRDGRNTVKIDVTGLTSNAYSGVQQFVGDINEGDILTASVWVYTEDLSSIDNGACLELYPIYPDGSRNTSEIVRIANLAPSIENEWQLKVAHFKAPAYTKKLEFYAWVRKNGVMWISSPKVERGHNENPVWTPAASEMVGKDGQWRKWQWALGSETAPTGTWQDTPMSAPTGQYVWIRSGVVVPPATTPATWDPATRVTGDKGADGQSVYMLDLSDEMMPMPCDASGNVVGTYSTSQASVFKGGTKVTSGITYSIAQQTGVSATITSAGLVTPSNLTADRGTIVVQAVVAGVTLQTTLSLYKVKPGATGAAGSSYTPNLFLNSAYKAGTDEWNFWRVPTWKGITDGVMTVYTASDQQVVYNKRIPVEAGDKFTLSGWIKADRALSLDYSYMMYETNGNVIISEIATVDKSVTTEWKFFSVCFTAKRAGNASAGFGYAACYNATLYLKDLKWERGFNDNPVWTPAASEMIGTPGADAVVYQLELSANNITRNALGQRSTSAITVQKYKTTGASMRGLTTEKAIRYIRVGVDTDYTALTAATSSYQIPVPDDPALTAIIVELFDGPVTLDRERIPVIEDGAVPTENLVRNSEGAVTSRYAFIGSWKLTEALVEGETYTFTVWGAAATGSTLTMHNPRVIVTGSSTGALVATLAQIAPGIYSAVATIASGGLLAIDRKTIELYQSSQLLDTTIERIKVEKGANYAPVWTQSTHDVDYLKAALKESGSIEGGLILGSLMRLGYTDASGKYNVTAGMNGIATPSDAPAVWTGGEMIDRAVSTADNAAKAMLRHDGTAYLCSNTVRFYDRLMQVGDNVQLDERGFTLIAGGNTALHIGDVPIGDAGKITNVNAPLTGSMGLSPVMLYLDTSGVVRPVASPDTMVWHNNAPAGTVLTAQGTITWTPGYVENEPDIAGNINMEVLVAGKVIAIYNYIIGSYSDGSTTSVNFNFGPLTTPAQGKVELRLSFGFTEPENSWKEIPGNPFGPLSLNFTGGRAFYDAGNNTILGNDGLLAIWGQSQISCTAEAAIMRFGDNILRVDANGIRKSTNGGKTWNNL